MKGMKTPAGWVALSTLSEADQESLFAKAKIEERLKDENTYNCKWGNNIDCFVNEKDPTKFVLVRDDGGLLQGGRQVHGVVPFHEGGPDD